MYNSKVGIGLAIAFITGIIVGVAGLTLTNRVQPAPIVIQPPPATEAPPATSTPGPIRVFVNGQVTAADVYELPPGSIVQTAIEAAGGYTDEANTAVINLAQPLQDGMQLYIPSLEEAHSEPIVVVNNAQTNDTVAAETAVENSGSTIINLNTASLAELDTLPGIGPSTAQKIIDHRNQNGPFATIEGVMDVTGIGEAKFAQMKDLITVDGE